MLKEEKNKHLQACFSRSPLTSGHRISNWTSVSPDSGVYSRTRVSRALFVWWLLCLLQNVDLTSLTDPLCHVAIALKNAWYFISVFETPNWVMIVTRISVVYAIT